MEQEFKEHLRTQLALQGITNNGTTQHGYVHSFCVGIIFHCFVCADGKLVCLYYWFILCMCVCVCACVVLVCMCELCVVYVFY